MTELLHKNSLDLSKRYIVAVSGGLDSMVLLHQLHKLQITCIVAHCNFQLRDREADLDEQLVFRTALKYGMECCVKKFDTPSYASQYGMGIQEAARKLRYDFFDELLVQHKASAVITAHHANDQAETVFFRLIRGTALRGLTGMQVMQPYRIKPLLHCTRFMLEQYATTHQIEYRQDASNLESYYLRNFIRNKIFPLIEEKIPDVQNRINQTAARLQHIYMYYAQQMQESVKQYSEFRNHDLYIPIRKLKKNQMADLILFEIMQTYGFSFEQAMQGWQLHNRNAGAIIKSHSHQFIKDRDFFIITALQTTESTFIPIQEDDTVVEYDNQIIHIRNVEHMPLNRRADCNICWVDKTTLQFPLILRKWKQGDYIYPLGMTKKKKVSKIFIDAKIPLHEKENFWILESNKKIVWIVGLKPDNRFKITEKTKEILQIEMKKS